MNRSDLLALEETRVYRHVAWADDNEGAVLVDKPEIRAKSDGSSLTYFGHASVTERAYDVYGGAPFGWSETVARGAFKRTLLRAADVNFLLNHDGMSMARTKSGTLTLDEDAQGLRVAADLDPANPRVQELKSGIERGDVDEMSFGFRVTADEWTDDDGEPSNAQVGTQRRILEVNLNRGDVSAVNYGANPATSGGFRGLDRALAELRAGKPLSDDQRAVLRDFAHGLDETTVEPEVPATILALQNLHRFRKSA